MDIRVVTTDGKMHDFAMVERPFAENNGQLILKRRLPGGEWETTAIYAAGNWSYALDMSEASL